MEQGQRVEDVQAALPVSAPPRRSPLGTFSAAWVLRDVSAGLIIGLLVVTLGISLATLIYSGELAVHLARAIGLVLFGGVVMMVVVSLLSSMPGTIAAPQDASAAVLAALSASLVSQLVVDGTPEAGRFFTMVAVVVSAAVVTGVLFLLFGGFRLGRLVRYLPYPVLGGFMAGTGWLLLAGGLGIMLNRELELRHIGVLFEPGNPALWLPALAFAVALLVITRINRHFLVWPAAMLVGTALFYLVMVITGGTPADWRGEGLLLGPLPGGSLLAPLTGQELTSVRWDVVISQLPTIVTVAFIALIALLLNAVGAEKTTGTKVELDRELRAAGLANLLSGPLGGAPGHHALVFTNFSYSAGNGTRLTAFVAAGVVGLSLLFGASTIELIPKPIIAGLVGFLGLELLYKWLVSAFHELALVEYLIVVAILLAIMLAGVLPGVGLGLLLAVALFAFSASRVDAVRYAVGGAELRSRVTRRPSERALLRKHGDAIVALQLQGYLFFGTATALLERLERRLAEQPKVASIVLDFSRVTGVDSTGISTIENVGRIARAAGADLLLSSPPGRLVERLTPRGRGATNVAPALLFGSQDEALEYAEERLLESLVAHRNTHATEADVVVTYPPEEFDFAALTPYLEERALRPGEVFIRQGDPADKLFFLLNGQVTAATDGASGERVRLETLRYTGLVGELAFYRGGVRSATVRADLPSTILTLSRQALARLTAEEPQLAARLHEQVARMMAGRVTHLMEAVESLQR